MGSKMRPEKSKGELSKPGKFHGGVKCAHPQKSSAAIWRDRSGTQAAACRPRRPSHDQTPPAVAQAPRRAQGTTRATTTGTGTARRAADLDKLRTPPRTPADVIQRQTSSPKPRTVILHKWYKCILYVFPA